MTTIPARLSIVTLGVEDFPRMKSFYEGLGFSPSIDMPIFALYVLGGVGLGLMPIDELAAEAGMTGVPHPSRGFTLAMNVDEKTEVDGAWQAWVDAGATPITEPEDRPWGGRSGYVADPEGNRWEVAWAPMATFSDQGAVVTFG